MNLLELTKEINNYLVKWHRTQTETPQSFKITNNVKLYNDNTIATITNSFKFKVRELRYQLVITELDSNTIQIAGTIISADKLPIALSRLKYKAFKVTFGTSENIANALFVKVWPIVRYWQDVTQLHWTKINTFELLYGKVAGLLDKIKKDIL